jgi:hypothetical protein
MEYVIAILAVLTIAVLIYNRATRDSKAGGQGGQHESGEDLQK